jgi:small subunit ribosomal protein S21
MREPTCQIKVKKGQNIEKSLRRLKKIMDKEGILQSVRDRRYYKKPSERKKDKRNQRRRRKK